MATSEFFNRDRVSRIRQALEEDGTVAELYSRHAVSHKPWDNALGQRVLDQKPKGAEVCRGDLKRIFPDAELLVEDAIESGDKVVVRWRMRGTHSGEFRGINPTNNPVDVTGINIYRFVGDKIVESWGEVDSASLARQCSQQAIELLSRPEVEV